MTPRMLFIRCCLAFAVALVPAWCFAAKRTAKTTPPSHQPQQETVDLFEAIDAGQIDVKFIAKNEKQARVQIKNKAGKPLTVRLPEAFAARPVLAQIGPLAGGVNAGGPNGGSQNLGSTFNGVQNNGNQNAAGANFFNVPAEKTRELRVPCVCLDYGKPTPRAAMPYEVVPLETVSDEPSLAGVLAKLENSNQPEIQAAAWHIASGMTWPQLASARIEHLVGLSEPLFTAKELKSAKELLDEVTSQLSASPALSKVAGP